MRKRTYFKESTEITDSEGNVLTQEQINFFKSSKARNRKGQLLVCYHGTPTPGFIEFNPREAKSQFGDYKFEKYNVNYFTTNLDTARGYTQMGVGDVDDKYKNIYAVYLNIQNPYIVDNSTPAEIKSWQNVRDKRIREIELKAFDRLVKRWAYDDSRISQVENQLNADLHKFNHGVRRNERHPEYWDLIELDSNKAWGSAHPVMWEYETVDELFDDEDRIKELLVGVSDDDEYGEDDYFYTLDYIVNWVLYLNEEEGTNYDGIIVEDILDIGPHGSMFGGTTTDIITLKSSNQIKSIKNKAPSSSNNINEEKIVGEGMKNIRLFLSKNKLNEEVTTPELDYNVKDIEKEASFLKYQYNLDDPNDSYYAAVEFFNSDDWYELRRLIRDAVEELDGAFESLRTYPDRKAEIDYRSRAMSLVNTWNELASIAKKEIRNAESDDDRYTLFRAIDTDGWAISNIPHSVISKIITG